jgi:hypothetical protein
MLQPMSKSERQKRWRERSGDGQICLTVVADKDVLNQFLLHSHFLQPLDSGERDKMQVALQTAIDALLEYE